MMRLIATTLFAALCAGPLLGDEYKRIASAGGDITEIIYALGAGDRIIGVDSTSGYPEQAKDKEQIGYVRALSAEGILALSPDLLIGAEDMGPPNVIENLQAAGLDVTVAPLGTGADRVTQKIAFVGNTLGMETAADQLILEFDTQMKLAMEQRSKLTQNPKVLFILSVRDGAPIVGGAQTSAHDIIELAGGQNVADSFNGWKPMNAEAIISAAPDLILMSGAHFNRIGGKIAILGRPDIALTPAGKSGNLHTMDAMLLLGFGPRTPEAVTELVQIFEGTK